MNLGPVKMQQAAAPPTSTEIPTPLPKIPTPLPKNTHAHSMLQSQHQQEGWQAQQHMTGHAV